MDLFCSAVSCSYGKNVDARPILVHRYESALRQRCGVSIQRVQDDLATVFRRRVLSPYLDYARRIGIGCGKYGSEIQVVREDNLFPFSRPRQDLTVFRTRRANGRPMHGSVSRLRKERDPVRRQVHVEDKLHAGTRGNSTSSVRQAA